MALKDLVSQVLTFDYLGALAVSVAFPLVLVPQLGLIRTGLLFGLMNACVAVWALWLFRHELRQLRAHAVGLLADAGGAAGGGFAVADHITTWPKTSSTRTAWCSTATTPYQRIVVTYGRVRQGGLPPVSQRQPAVCRARRIPLPRGAGAPGHVGLLGHGGRPKQVAVLGGGDGMAVREVLKYPGVESVTLVELDPAMTTALFRATRRWRDSTAMPCSHPRCKSSTPTRSSGWNTTPRRFDVIIVDFPDPTNFSIGKLYTNSFYALLDQRLSASGYAVIQTTSPLVARKSFWTVVSTIESVGLQRHALPRQRAQLWRVGLCGGQPPAVPSAHDLARRACAFWMLTSLPLLFDFPAGHGARADRGQPPVQPGAGDDLRAGVGQGGALMRAQAASLSGAVQHCLCWAVEAERVVRGGFVGASPQRGTCCATATGCQPQAPATHPSADCGRGRGRPGRRAGTASARHATTLRCWNWRTPPAATAARAA